MQRSPCSFADGSLAAMMKSSAILTQTGASTSQIKSAIKQVHGKHYGHAGRLLEDSSIAQLRGGPDETYILPEYQPLATEGGGPLAELGGSKSSEKPEAPAPEKLESAPPKVAIQGESFCVLLPPEVDTTLYGKREKDAVIAALRKRLNHQQRLRGASSHIEGQVGGKDRPEPLGEFSRGGAIDKLSASQRGKLPPNHPLSSEQEDPEARDILETLEYSRVARAAGNLTALRTVIGEDARQKGRGVNAPKVLADRADQRLIDQYENRRALRPEVYERIVSGVQSPPSKDAAGASRPQTSSRSPEPSPQRRKEKGLGENVPGNATGLTVGQPERAKKMSPAKLGRGRAASLKGTAGIGEAGETGLD